MKAAAAPLGAPWLWTILCYEDRQPVHGYKVTREAAMAVREELAAGVVQLKPETEVEATSILPSLNVKTARPRRGILPFTHLTREGRMTVTIGRRELLAALGGAVAWPLAARAQQAGKLPTIGFLGAPTPLAWRSYVPAFVQRLNELGWIE